MYPNYLEFIFVILCKLAVPGHLNILAEHSSFKNMDVILRRTFNSEIYFCSDKSQESYAKDWESVIKNAVQISICNSSAQVKKILEILQLDSTNPYLILHLNFRTLSETLDAVEHVSKYYIPEDQFRKALSVVITWPSKNTNMKPLDQKFPLSSQVYFRFIEDSFTAAKTWEVYYIGRENYINEVDKKCSSLFELGPQIYECQPLRNDFRNTLIRAVAIDVIEERFSAGFIRNGSELTFDSGFSVDLIKDLRDSLNFTIKAVAGQDYISKSNQSVGGMGSQLLTKEADVIISMSYVLPYRIKYLTPSVHIHQDKIMVYFRQPRQETHRNIFINPFSYNTWACLVTTWISFICSAYLMSVIKGYQNYYQYPDFYMWIFGAICQKSYYLSPSHRPQRILFLTIFLMSLIIYAFYAASIISRLTVSLGALNSLKDLFAANFQFLADPQFTYSKFITEIFSDPNSDSNNSENAYINDTDSLQKAFAGGFGFASSIDSVMISSRNLNISERQICELLSNVPFDGLMQPLSFYFRKGSPLQEPFNAKLTNFFNRGFRYRYMKYYVWNTTPFCLPLEKNSIEIIRFSDVSSAFYGLIIAYFITSFIVLLEVIYKCKQLNQE